MYARICFATDLHFISPRLTDNGESFQNAVLHTDGKLMLRVADILDAFIHDVLDLRPDALVLGGDMTFNGETASHEDLAAAFLPLKDAGIPVLCIPGNHDLGQYPAVRFAGDKAYTVTPMTPEAFAALFSPFGVADAVSQAPDSMSCLFCANPGLYLLMLDGNSLWKDFAGSDRRMTSAGEVSGATLQWMEEALAGIGNENATVIGVSHQSLLAHNPMFVEGFRMRGYENVLALYRRYGVLLNLCGHMHIQHICKETSDGSGLTEIATSALSVAPLQYGVVTVESPDAPVLAYENRPLPVPFCEEAITFFKENAGDQIARILREQATQGKSEPSFSDEEIALIRDAFAVCNTAYFAGDPFPDACYERGTSLYEGLRLLLSQDHTFHGIYLKSILTDRKKHPVHHTWTFA